MNDLIDIVRAGFRRAGQTRPPCVVVVGDVMLDRYLWGDVERISPEAPVPVVRLKHETARLGGAGNVAANLAGLGVTTHLAGIIGADADGDSLSQALAQAGVAAQAMRRSASHPTITKTRVIGGHQQMLRLDREESGTYLPADLDALLANACRLIDTQNPAVLLLSDYAKGALPPDLCQALIAKARTAGAAVLVDPKGRDFAKYRGATGITPNKHEAAMACGVPAGDTPALLASMADLQRDLGLDFIALTRGSEGISLLDAEGEQLFPAEARQVFDVSGAGDTVIAALAAAMAAALTPRRACALANAAASVVVGKVGTVPIQHAELLQALEQQSALDQAHKFMDLETLAQQVEAWRKQGLRIVFTNGCFDLLHVGHVTYLGQARRLGDRLVVGLNSDRSVRALKGPSRPVIHETDRAHVLCALEAVSAVTLFDDDTPLALIKRLRPDVLVKGSDYTEAQVVGAAEVRAWGGKLALIPVVPGRSSSQIIETLGGRQDANSSSAPTA